MKLYDKKFLIYGNCMIRSFGQPGFLPIYVYMVQTAVADIFLPNIVSLLFHV